ncbi:MAG: PilZ domain-containing protein [Deltaproteobacteria bacterium]|jgi:hypothetical protein|nr:PilZ domain-containing protein [Deltaproteobacteria bacterium]MBK8238464.1 PilZ domain-containing protein [Deltaproteobacteria bacterium]MBK8717291.1 PilZ domain-containing protein [Deltaproteobacteria bacterium]MBP7286159.1 PilZ domain-containing protein [Nannocystaceae bacterium]
MTPVEQRRTERIATTLAILVTRDGVEHRGSTINLSLGGALVRVQLTPPPHVGQRVRVALTVPTHAAPLVADAEVRWIGPLGEYGLQFVTGFRARETWALGQWLERVRKGGQG